jgi:hypothetical protein
MPLVTRSARHTAGLAIFLGLFVVLALVVITFASFDSLLQ